MIASSGGGQGNKLTTQYSSVSREGIINLSDEKSRNIIARAPSDVPSAEVSTVTTQKSNTIGPDNNSTTSDSKAVAERRVSTGITGGGSVASKLFNNFNEVPSSVDTRNPSSEEKYSSAPAIASTKPASSGEIIHSSTPIITNPAAPAAAPKRASMFSFHK